MKKKMVAILSGGDWYDAEVKHIVLLKPIDLDEAKKKREKWYQNEYCPQLQAGEKSKYYDFTEWLIKEGLAREATDNEITIYWD